MPTSHHLTRRRFFVVAGAAVLAVPAGLYAGRRILREPTNLDREPKGVFPEPERVVDCARPANPVVAENCRAGSTDWRLTRLGPGMEGFFGPGAVDRGQDATLFVRTRDPEYRVRVFRTGSYRGAGARQVAEAGPRAAQTQPEPRRVARTGYTSAANWSASMRFDTSEWPSGVYLARMTGSSGEEDHAILVVREPERAADAVVLLSDTTFQAYNQWGGASLYSGGEERPRAVEVSLDRPFGNGAISQADWYLCAEFPLVKWLEGEGYDVTYALASDVGSRPLGTRGAWIWGSHSEYWSQGMRDATERARDAGVHQAVFGANTCYWRVRFIPDPFTGDEGRRMVCYKSNEDSVSTVASGRVEDPVSPTGMWRDPGGADDPENALLGIMYVGQDLRRNYPLQVTSALAAGSAAWRGVDLGGDTVDIGQELVGWEWDSIVDNGRTPSGIERLAATPVGGDLMSATGVPGTGDATQVTSRYRHPGGAWVFATGSILWSWGLDASARRAYSPGKPQGEPDVRIRQLTANVLRDMGMRPGSRAVDLKDLSA